MVLYVFDFDETLARTSIFKSMMFGSPSAIESAKPLPLLEKMFNMIKNEHEVFILTARPEHHESKLSIQRFLASHGCFLPLDHILMSGSAGKAKADFIEQLISELNPIAVHFYDDLMDNIQSVAGIRSSIPIYTYPVWEN